MLYFLDSKYKIAILVDQVKTLKQNIYFSENKIFSITNY